MVQELREMLFQALGEASMCWSEYPKGVFKSERCKEISEEVIRAFDRAAANTASMQCPHFYRGTDGVHVCIVERCSHPGRDKWAQHT